MIWCCNINLGDSIPGLVLHCPSCGATITCKVGAAVWDYPRNAPTVLSSPPMAVQVMSVPTAERR